MKQQLSAWRTALRIARRETRRAKGRSALVVLMIMLPAAGLAFAAVTYDMFSLTPEERVNRLVGTADARLNWAVDGPITQFPDPNMGWGPVTASVAAPPADGKDKGPPRKGAYEASELLAHLPPGTRVIPTRANELRVRTATGLGRVSAYGMDLDDPLVRGYADLVDGRAPRTATEVAASRAALTCVGATLGGTVTAFEGGTYTVTGIVEMPGNLGEQLVFSPSGFPQPESEPWPDTWLADTPGPVTWEDVQKLNEKGIFVYSRQVILNPPPMDAQYQTPTQTLNVEELAIGVLVFGLGVLEVVLLAGPAFAISARRRSRQLALVAANGGTPAHVRRIVLADGVVLGVLGAGCGIVFGILLAFAGRPLVEESLANSRAGAYRVFPAALAAIGILAVVTGLLAAAVPAFVAARQSIIAALSGRRGIAKSRKRWVFVGLGLAALGGVVAGYGTTQVSANLVLAGLVLGELGLVLCTPALVGLIARLGRLLPLAPRIALRDTARNRAAAAPAISAVMAAVAGSVAIGLYLGSDDARRMEQYQPQYPIGMVNFSFGVNEKGQPNVPLATMERTAREILPITTFATVDRPMCAPAEPGRATCVFGVMPSPAKLCPYLERMGMLSPEEQRTARQDPRCGTGVDRGLSDIFGTIVNDGSALPVLTGASAEDIRRATETLRAGGAVVANPQLVDDGQVMLSRFEFGMGPRPTPIGEPMRVPAYVLTSGVFSWGSVISPDLAQRAGLATQLTQLVAGTERMPTVAEEDRFASAMDALGVYGAVERGEIPGQLPVVLILALAAAVITLGAAGIATGLALADGRGDLSTLAAVGASPRLRRMLSLSQSGVIAGLGSLLGAVAGLGAGSAILAALNQGYAEAWPAPTPFPITVPWLSLAVSLLFVPGVAMLGAGLFTRSRLPIERRPG